MLSLPVINQLLDNGKNFVANINFSQPSWDLFIILFFLLAAFIYGLSLGRDRIVIVLVSIYIAFTIVTTAPWLKDIVPAEFNINNIFTFRVTAFLLGFIVVFFLLSRSTLLSTIARADAPGHWWQVILLSLLHVGLFIALTLSFLPAEIHSGLTPFTRQLFVGPGALFGWIIAPVLGMAIMRDKKDKSRE